MDQLAQQRRAQGMATEAELCRLLAAQLSVAAEAEALLSQAMRLEAALAAAAPQAPPR